MSVPRLIKLKKKNEFQEDVFKIVDDEMKDGPTLFSLDQTTKDPTGGIYFQEQLIKEIDYSEDQTINTQRKKQEVTVEPKGEEIKILVVPADHYAQQCYHQNEMLLDKKKYVLRKFNAKHMMLNALAHELNKVEKRTDKMIDEFAQHKTDMIQIKKAKVDHDDDVEREGILQKFERLERQMAQFQDLDNQSQFDNQSKIGTSQVSGSYVTQNRSNFQNKSKPPQPPQIGNQSNFSNNQKSQLKDIKNSYISNQQTIEQSQSINLDDWLNSIPDRPVQQVKVSKDKRQSSTSKQSQDKTIPKRTKPQSAAPQRQKLWK